MMEPSTNPTTNPTTAEQPLIENTFPLQPEPAPPPAAPPPDLRPRRHWLKPVLLGLIVLVGLAGMLGGTYWFGYSHGKAALAKVDAAGQATALQVPKGATIIEQCSKGRGAQYVLPSNIPRGPVFNVFNGKVIGIEYMISPDDLSEGYTFFNLPTYGQKFDHLDIGLLSKGHTGYPEPHYHVDLYTVSRSVSESSKCQ
jgi:hypothetical protein